MLGRLLLLLLVGVGGAAYAAGAFGSEPMPAAPVPQSARSVELQVEGVLDALAQAKQRHEPQPIALSFTDGDLTAAAARYFPQSYVGLTFSDPVVTLRPGQLALSGRATAGPLRSSFSVVGTVALADGRPVARVASASVGGVALPDAARAAIEQDLQGAVDSLLPSTLRLTSVVIASGSLAVRGAVNP